MTTRRDFLRSAALLSGAAFTRGGIPASIARALSIDPPPGTTFRDAEHVVILMQENRSFDHCYGALRGVRGFRDPRAHVQPNGNPVWFQSDAHGDTYAPFHLDIANTNATWVGGLPHTWTDQVDARAGGRYDQWLIAKPKKNLPLPFTLGHYSRADIPFYYALADAFTVCDQAFCSSLTGTTANRLFLFTGTIRNGPSDVPRVMNADTYYDKEASWTTFPERLENAGVSWRIYQNELSYDSGLEGDALAWLANFTDNPIEWFTQYHVRLAARGRRPNDVAWDELPARTKSLHDRAFTTNAGDPNYRSLTSLTYHDGAAERTVSVPAGDVLHQFRKDVASGSLPAVSWLVAPENFSDHPSAPWYGAWYVSETLDILTKNPELWKKTVLILCYDENDGYFDHVPPYAAPHPAQADAGRTAGDMDTSVDWANVYGRDHSIGLGYRVPLVVVSPWTRGGCVNSQVFDHTSVIRFLESWLGAKGLAVRESNISDWRRTVCGDLTSAFQQYDGGPIALPSPLDHDATVERIYNAKFRPPPDGGVPLEADAVAHTDVGALQERGTKPSCPLPYELLVNAHRDGDSLAITFEARDRAFGAAASGAPFNVYSYGPSFKSRAYAVRAGETVTAHLPVETGYHVRVDGPNGFMREFVHKAGAGGERPPTIAIEYENQTSLSGVLLIEIGNNSSTDQVVTIHDETGRAPDRAFHVPAGGGLNSPFDTKSTYGWYDFTVRSGALSYRCAGRIETGRWSISDPAMA